MSNDSPKPSELPVAIVGAGLTGLTVAHELACAGRGVVVFESAPFIGGNVRTGEEDGFLFEYGPHTLLFPRPTPWPLLQRLGLADKILEPNPAAKKRYLVREKKAHAMPADPLGFLRTPLFSAKAKLRVMREPFSSRAKNDEETMAEFVTRHLGKEFLDYALDPFVRGVYAGDARELSLKWAFPRMRALEDKHRSLVLGALAKKISSLGKRDVWRTKTFSFPRGLQELPQALAASLPQDSVRLNTRITAIEQLPGNTWKLRWTDAAQTQHEQIFSALVLTVPAHALESLPLAENMRAALSPLGDVTHAAVTVVHQGFRREAIEHPLDGFGMLVSSKEPFEILGTLFSSSTFEGRAPQGHVLISTFIGGRQRPDLALADEQTQLSIIARDTKKLLGVRGVPVFQKRLVYPHAIAQYRPGHGKIVEACEYAQEKFPGLFLCGNYREGIAASAALTRGLDTAALILNHKGRK